MFVVPAYLVYLAVSVGVTVWVGRILFRNGRVFLLDAFPGSAALADSVNHLLVAGFYLINIGYVALALRTGETLVSTRQAIELVCDKIGVVLLVLGAMHFFNLYVLNRLRKRSRNTAGGRHPTPEPWSRDAPIGRVLE
jgi:cytochrome c biogenesis protein CcdA